MDPGTLLYGQLRTYDLDWTFTLYDSEQPPWTSARYKGLPTY
jgi:hypothetical protein